MPQTQTTTCAAASAEEAQEDVVPLSQQLCFSVYAAAHAFTAAYKPLLEPLRLTYPQYLVLLALWEEDGLSVKGIAERLRIDSATVTPLLKRLEAAGFVTRRRDPSNERVLVVELTEQGRALRKPAAGVRQRVVCALGGAEPPIQALKQEIDRLIPLLSNLEAAS
ncbi:MarR family winged helix-turn-helix transcriptional regulator [Methylorubrum extorquens]|jgi:DNA-binding MarR family transcriptional regulator